MLETALCMESIQYSTSLVKSEFPAVSLVTVLLQGLFEYSQVNMRLITGRTSLTWTNYFESW